MWLPIIIPLGLRERKKIVDNKVRTCINCKNTGVQLVKNDEWFHLFFVPLFKVSKNNVEYLHCPTCGCTVPYYDPYEEDEKENKKEKKKWRKKHKYDGPPKPDVQQQPQPQPQPTQLPPEYYNQQYPNSFNQQQQQYPQMSQEYYNQQNPNQYNPLEPQFKSDESGMQHKYFNENQPIPPPDKNYNK